MIKFRLWLARVLIGKHGAIFNMKFTHGIDICTRHEGARALIYGNLIIP